jgi:hypothetical protein
MPETINMDKLKDDILCRIATLEDIGGSGLVDDLKYQLCQGGVSALESLLDDLEDTHMPKTKPHIDQTAVINAIQFTDMNHVLNGYGQLVSRHDILKELQKMDKDEDSTWSRWQCSQSQQECPGV